MTSVFEKVLQISVGLIAVSLGDTTSLKDVALGVGGLAILGCAQLERAKGADTDIRGWTAPRALNPGEERPEWGAPCRPAACASKEPASSGAVCCPTGYRQNPKKAVIQPSQ